MRSLVLLGVVASLTGSSVLAEGRPQKVKPVMVWTGTDSKQAKESFARCCSQEAWRASWHKHHGRDKDVDDLTCPEVDFESYMVLVIFHGEETQNHGIQIVEVLEEDECVRVRYRPSWYQIGFRFGEGQIDLKKYDTQSFVFVVLPRCGKAMVLEEDVQNIIGKPPVWKERKRFAAIDKKVGG